MKKTNKWSEQSLVEQTFGYTDNGTSQSRTLRCLDVCLSGKELYRRDFIDGKYKDANELLVPFDFLVMMGSMGAPDGRFYELEYTIGDHGIVYRALIQAANPVEDIQLIIGVLKQKNLLPSNLTPNRAWLRDDIDAVRIGSCSKDDDGVSSFYSGCVEAKDSDESLVERAVKYGNLGVCIEYYRGDCREVWIPQQCDCSQDKIFVCGVNCNDPEFAQRKNEDMDRLSCLIHEVNEIICDYNLPHFLLVDQGGEDIENRFHISTNLEYKKLHMIVDSMERLEHHGNNEED